MLNPSQISDRDSAPGRFRYSCNVMNEAFRPSKRIVQAPICAHLKDRRSLRLYDAGMAVPGHDWYLKEWMATLGKKQADIVSDLEWNPARISLMLRGKQQYTRDAVNELSAYLNLQPFELLMHPEDAMALRQLRATALRIAADSQKDDDAESVRATG